jgi:hypothetical protein
MAMARVPPRHVSRTFWPAHTEVPGATAEDCAAARERRRVAGRRLENCILKVGDV